MVKTSLSLPLHERKEIKLEQMTLAWKKMQRFQDNSAENSTAKTYT
jgi:hypothetical protein